ncbi:TetR family transcriptional regulator [Spirillospora sp. NPDC029432]|uniref:TetR/AcrR family transcriptional regulator n=1 Tax=Spirillospora sp. NPDC029432 TaxID=3154599 RepID=UPI003452398A
MSSPPARTRNAGPAPSGRRTDEVRQAAAALFEQHGYAATTMTQIADATGLFPGSLYHHFGSKEQIAVEILRRFDEDLDAVSTKLTASIRDLPPEKRLNQLAREVVSLSLRNGAAIQLRVFEPPTVATERLHDAWKLHTPVLDRLWKSTIDDIAGSDPEKVGKVPLLRFALKNLTLDAAAHFPRHPDPAAVADDLCDLLLRGITADHPGDEELDRSEALRAVDDALSTWPARSRETGDDVRDRIIAAARTTFARRGYAATTIRDIAELAEVRMATLYRRVESKEAILREVIEGFSASLETATRAALTTGDSEAASLDALAKVFVHGRRRFREESDILRFERTMDSDPTSLDHSLAHYSQQTRERLQLLEGVLERGMAKGTLRRIAPPQTLAPHIRYVLWVTYQDFGRTSEDRAHAFLRGTMLRGFLNS